MHILLIGPAEPALDIPPKGWGAIEKILWRHTLGFEKAGHSVVLFNQRSNEQLLSLIREQSFTIIHAYHHWPLPALETQAQPYIYTCNAAEWKQQWSAYGAHFRRVPWGMPCEAMADRVLSPLVYPVFNGADPALFSPVEGEEQKPYSAAIVGQNIPRKRHRQVVDLLADRDSYHLTIIGPGNEEFEGLPRVRVLPDSPEPIVAAVLRQTDFFFQLSEEEVDSLAVKEAAMAGCRLVLSDYNARVLGGHCSWTDYEHFEQCPESYRALARAHALEHYSWDRVIEHTLAGYEYFLDKDT